jgi:CRISPR/Cas system endoribonuclease Cas6 (RAMP superfamily)
MNELNMVHMICEAKARREVLLPGFLGNTFRGCLGRALLQQHCPKSAPDCMRCAARHTCVYARVFKAAECAQTCPAMPSPFVIGPPSFGKRLWREDETLAFSLLLFGTAVHFAPEIGAAARTIFDGSFAQTKDALSLVQIMDGFTGRPAGDNLQIAFWSDTSAEEMPPIQGARVRFETPTQILQDHRVVEQPSFAQLMNSLFGRIAAMLALYGAREFILPYALMNQTPQVQAQFDTHRICVQQDKGQHIDGIVGQVTYTGDLTRYMPYLQLGTLLHIGKKTTRGCGVYTMDLEA